MKTKTLKQLEKEYKNIMSELKYDLFRKQDKSDTVFFSRYLARFHFVTGAIANKTTNSCLLMLGNGIEEEVNGLNPADYHVRQMVKQIKKLIPFVSSVTCCEMFYYDHDELGSGGYFGKAIEVKIKQKA